MQHDILIIRTSARTMARNSEKFIEAIIFKRLYFE
jgi:hypothetical protein